MVSKQYREKILKFLEEKEIAPNGSFEYKDNWISPQAEWQKRFGDDWVNIPLIDLMLEGGRSEGR